jgi:hypothetical protein
VGESDGALAGGGSSVLTERGGERAVPDGVLPREADLPTATVALAAHGSPNVRGAAA